MGEGPVAAPEPATPPDGRTERIRPRRGLARWLYLVTGILFVGLAALGAVLPVLPTTPFLLAAAACFARSSQRLYDRLLASRMFGPLIRDWRAHRILPVKAKVWAVSLIVLVGGASVATVPVLWVKVGLSALLLGLTAWLLRIPSTGPVSADDATRPGES